MLKAMYHAAAHPELDAGIEPPALRGLLLAVEDPTRSASRLALVANVTRAAVQIVDASASASASAGASASASAGVRTAGATAVRVVYHSVVSARTQCGRALEWLHDNVRTISQVDYERCLLRKKQDAEYKEAVDNEDPPPPTLEELRALRVKYFTQQQSSQQLPRGSKKTRWAGRLRSRKTSNKEL